MGHHFGLLLAQRHLPGCHDQRGRPKQGHGLRCGDRQTDRSAGSARGDITGVTISDSERNWPSITMGRVRRTTCMFTISDSRKAVRLTKSLNPQIDPADLLKAR